MKTTEQSLEAAEQREANSQTISAACAEAWEETVRINRLTPLTRKWLEFSEAVERALAYAPPHDADDYGRRCMSAGRWL